MQSVYLQRIMNKNADKGPKNTKPKQSQFPKWPKMNVNLYVTKDYENETAFGPKKTNPIKPCPERSRMGQFLQRPKSLARKSGHTHESLVEGLLWHSYW